MNKRGTRALISTLGNKTCLKSKRSQITIFIIIGIIVVVLAILLFLFFPQIKTTFGFSDLNPSEFIQDCIEEEIANNILILSAQGGSLNPEHYILYNNEKIEYLCYTNEYYKTCVMQQPMLKEHIESEIADSIVVESNECFNSMKKSFEKRGYSVDLKQGTAEVELLPERISVNFNNALTLTKSEQTEKYDSIKVVLNNNLYELISITNSILNWEARYGDSETTIYMNYYHDLKVEKKKQS
ncbi:MAG: hypothetical protein ABIG69_06185, partial [Bacteroidota bacterium]